MECSSFWNKEYGKLWWIQIKINYLVPFKRSWQTWNILIFSFFLFLAKLSLLSRMTGFTRPTWGPPGFCRPQLGPCWPHELCYQGLWSLLSSSLLSPLLWWKLILHPNVLEWVCSDLFFYFKRYFYLCVWVCVIEVIIIHTNFMFFM